MSVYTKITFKAPKLVEFLKEKGIDISSKNGVFYEASDIKLPSGLSACIFDEDAWGATLYGPDEMRLPRNLGGVGSGGSFVLWLVNQLVEVGEDSEVGQYEEYEYDEDYCEEDEFFSDEFDNCMDFCKEIKNIFEEMYPDKKSWKKIGELDDLIEEAEILYLNNYWDGEGFDYTYAEMKNGQAFYWYGCSEDETELYEDWYWRDIKGFIKLVKSNIPATTYTRKNSKWVKG